MLSFVWGHYEVTQRSVIYVATMCVTIINDSLIDLSFNLLSGKVTFPTNIFRIPQVKVKTAIFTKHWKNLINNYIESKITQTFQTHTQYTCTCMYSKRGDHPALLSPVQWWSFSGQGTEKIVSRGRIIGRKVVQRTTTRRHLHRVIIQRAGLSYE